MVELQTAWWNYKLYSGTTKYMVELQTIYGGNSNYMVELQTMWWSCKLYSGTAKYMVELPTIWWDNKLYCGTTSYVGHYKLYSGTTNYMVELQTLWCKIQTIWCKLQTKWCNLKTIWCKLKNYRGTTEKLQTVVTFIGELFCWCNNHQRSNHKKKKTGSILMFCCPFLGQCC